MTGTPQPLSAAGPNEAPPEGSSGLQSAQKPATEARDAQAATDAADGHTAVLGPALRRALAVNAVGCAANEAGEWLPLSDRRAIANAVLAAIEPTLEHCIHDRAVHDQHHTRPVPGCPWCSEAGTDDIQTGGLT